MKRKLTRKTLMIEGRAFYRLLMSNLKIGDLAKVNNQLLKIVQKNIIDIEAFNQDIDYKNFIFLYLNSQFKFYQNDYDQLNFKPGDSDNYPQYIVELTNFLYDKMEDEKFCQQLAKNFEINYDNITTLFSNIFFHLAMSGEELTGFNQNKYPDDGVVSNYSYDRLFWFLVALEKGGIEFTEKMEINKKTNLKKIYSAFYNDYMSDILSLLEMERVKFKIEKIGCVTKNSIKNFKL